MLHKHESEHPESTPQLKLSDFELVNERAKVTFAKHTITGQEIIIKRHYDATHPTNIVMATQLLISQGFAVPHSWVVLANQFETHRYSHTGIFYTASEIIDSSYETLHDLLRFAPKDELVFKSFLLEPAIELAVKLEMLSHGVSLTDGRVATYDHQDIAPHNLIASTNNTLFLIDIEGEHFSLGNDVTVFANLFGDQPKASIMLKGIINAVGINAWLTYKEKLSLLAPWENLIVKNDSFNQLLHFRHQESQAIPNHVKKAIRYKKKKFW